MHNFVPIIRFDMCFQPARPRKDIEISFDGNSFRRHFQMLQERRNSEAFRNFALLAIDRNGHEMECIKSKLS